MTALAVETVTRSKTPNRGHSATRNAPAGLVLVWDRGWTCTCGQSGVGGEHCVGCHATDGHKGCWWCGKCLSPPRGWRLSTASYCSSSCRVYTSRWQRSPAGEQWQRDLDARRERNKEATNARDWFEDPLAHMFGFAGGFGAVGAYPEPPDIVALRILGLTQKPDTEGPIKTAFRKRLMQVHPDLAIYTDPTVRALWERVLGEEATVQELIWARDVLYRKLPPALGTVVTPQGPTEEERREIRRRRGESKRTGSLCGECGAPFESGDTRRRGRFFGGTYVACLTCAPDPKEPSWYRRWSKAKPCEGCGEPLSIGQRIWRRTYTCSERCDASVRRLAARLHRAAQRDPATCATCGERFDHGRRDSRYCSRACRQKAYRARSLPTTHAPEPASAAGAVPPGARGQTPRAPGNPSSQELT